MSCFAGDTRKALGRITVQRREVNLSNGTQKFFDRTINFLLMSATSRDILLK